MLIPAGIYCIATAVRKDPTYLPLSAIPVAFGVQQFLEGWVWVGLHNGDDQLVMVAALAFLFFALVFWPAWAPFGACAIEPGKHLKTALTVLASLGLVGGLIVFVPLALKAPDWLHVAVAGHSIQYRFAKLEVFESIPQSVWQVLYVLIVAAPLMVRVDRRYTTFSFLLVGAAAVSHVYFRYAYPSVWCYFAAVLSVYLCYLFQRLPRRFPEARPLVSTT